MAIVFGAWGLAWAYIACKQRRFGVLSLMVLVTGYAVLLAIYAETIRIVWRRWINS